MEEINKYKIIKQLNLNQDFIKNIKLFYVFQDKLYKYNVIIVTNDDKTYVYGSNVHGALGFGHSNEVKELTLNEELSNKQIVDLNNSYWHTIARTIDGNIYCWGCNGDTISKGFFWFRRNDEKIYKPELNQYLLDKHITDISCGESHTLVLTIGGRVYAWGNNEKGQIGNGNNVSLSIPCYVNGFNGEKVKAIVCGYWHSMALTETGNVFSWGSNTYGQLGFKNLKENGSINEPKLIEINETIDKISCGIGHSLLLSRDGDIFVFGRNLEGQLGDETIKEKCETPLKLKNQNKLVDIASHHHFHFSMALSLEGIIFMWGTCGEELIKTPIQTQFRSFKDALVHYKQITYKTIVIGNKLDIYRNKKYTLKNRLTELADQTIALPPKPQSNHGVILSESDVNDQIKSFTDYRTRYEHDFKQIEMIGKGSFGEVYKALNSFDQQYYAIKKISLSRLPDKLKQKSSEELKIMAKLQSDHIVQYKNSWVENNEILYIQMELCFSTLKEILLKKRDEFKRQKLELMSRPEYYISSELFKEILEAVNFLHKQNIIHRDLKTTNILITNGFNGRFVKLADFGLTVVHEYDKQTHTQDIGTLRYMAPEVKGGRNYDTKADIYSLGPVTQDVFDIDIQLSSANTIADQLLNGKYSTIYKIIENMMSVLKDSRQTCDQILKDEISWLLTMNELEIDFSQQSLNNTSIEENFHRFFIKTKLKFR